MEVHASMALTVVQFHHRRGTATSAWRTRISPGNWDRESGYESTRIQPTMDHASICLRTDINWSIWNDNFQENFVSMQIPLEDALVDQAISRYPIRY